MNKENIGKRVEVYRNHTKDCWSIRHKGIVIAYSLRVAIENPVFVVQPAGHARVLKEKRKNVHAFVRGTLIHMPYICLNRFKKLVKYNPSKHGFFYDADTDQPVYDAEFAHMHYNFEVTIP